MFCFPFINYMNETVSSVSILKPFQISIWNPSWLSTVGANGPVSVSIFNEQRFTGCCIYYRSSIKATQARLLENCKLNLSSHSCPNHLVDFKSLNKAVCCLNKADLLLRIHFKIFALQYLLKMAVRLIHLLAIYSQYVYQWPNELSPYMVVWAVPQVYTVVDEATQASGPRWTVGTR